MVRSFYNYLAKNESIEANFPFHQIWKVNSLSRVGFCFFFAWEVGHGSILTIDKLMRRGNIMVNGDSLCRRVEESCTHNLFWCLLAYKLWTMAYEFLGISWVIIGIVRDKIWAWKGIAGVKKHVDLISFVIFLVMRKERNKRACEGVGDDFVGLEVDSCRS